MNLSSMMYRLNVQHQQQTPQQQQQPPSQSQAQSAQPQLPTASTIPSHIILQQQIHAASPAAAPRGGSAGAAGDSAAGVNGGAAASSAHGHALHARHSQTSSSSSSAEDKLRLLTTAIKSEPLHDVLALAAAAAANSSNSAGKTNPSSNSNSNSINNAVALTVPSAIGNSSTSTSASASASSSSPSAAAIANNLNSVNSINLIVGSSAGAAATNGHLVFVPSKRARLDGPEDWISSPSPGSVPSSAPPLSPSPGSQNLSYNANTSNGYASPMSAGSYDPYSPNGKLGRDDLSPSSSLNGYSANEGCDAKKSKKGPAPRLQEELCLVCGDRASGYHYNALTCEGCKGFFRRSVTKNAVYCCKFGHACEMDMYMRRKCQECRLKKCLAVGMRPECVVPENQCAMKRREKKAQKEKDKQQVSPAVSTTDFVKKEILELMTCEPPTHQAFPLLPEELLLANQARNIPSLTINQLAVIYKLIWYQDGYEQPSEEDLKRIMISSPDENESQHDVSFRHITEITILTVQLIVEFAKGLPAFTKIPQEDQITLLKACSSEVMMLRMARRYDHNSDSIFFANNRSYTRDSYKMAGMADNIEDLLHFCRQMYAMKVDNVEYALLTAIVIFSDRPGLEEAELVEAIQSYYIDTLRIYILNRHCGDPKSLVFFAKLLSILTELRTLGNQNAEMCFSLKLKNRKLPKFLEEIWDVHAIPPSVQSHIQATQAAQEAAAREAASASTSSAAAAASSSTSSASASASASGSSASAGSTAAAASSSSSSSSSAVASTSTSGLNGGLGGGPLYGAGTTAPATGGGLGLMAVSMGQEHHLLGGENSSAA